MRNKRSFSLRGSGILLIAGILLFGSFFTFRALLTDGERTANAIAPTKNEAEIVEEFEPPEDPEPGPETYRKSIALTNTGPSASFLRLYIGFSDGSYEERSGFSSDGENYYSASPGGRPSWLSEEESGILSDSFVDHLPQGWTYIPADDPENGDLLGGYLYYQSIVPPGGTTTEVVKSVRTCFPDERETPPFDILVYAESIQTVSKEGAPWSDEDWLLAWREFLGKGGEDE